MSDFTIFEPLKETEKVSKYYTDNNLPLPDNKFFKDLFINPYLPEPFISEKEPPKKLFIKPEITKTKTTSKQEIETDEPKTTFVNTNSKSDLITHPIKKEIMSLDIEEDKKNYLLKLAELESSFRPYIVNKYGYFGIYQFGNLALKDIETTKEELQNTTAQHYAALKLTDLNEKRLKSIINDYVGKTVNGILISKDSILAAAHLLGASTVKDFFNGTTNTNIAKNGFVDGNGTHITKYLKEFSK